MATARDLKILRDAGIDDPNTLLTAAAAFLQTHPMQLVGAVENALSEEESALLARHGAQGLQSTPQAERAIQQNTVTIAGEYAQMVSTALSQRATAERLGVGTSRVRQRIDKGSIYALAAKKGRVCPQFQFAKSSTLPGLVKVLDAIGVGAHPVSVQRFFLKVSPDLVSDITGEEMSPREWLIAGHDVDLVCRLAETI